MECIADLRRVFHVLYLFEPLAPEHADEWSWFKDHVDDVMARFQRLVARGRESNYVHEIQKHGIALLERGGLAPFANDTHETLQCLLKQAFHNFSPRHGGDPAHDTLHHVWQRWFMRLHVLVLNARHGPAAIPALSDQLRTMSTLPDILSEALK
jgi:hypothetical protein